MGKSSSADKAAGQAAKAQSALAQQLINQSNPTRQALFTDSNAFLAGNRDVTSLPEFAAIKSATESQFGRARDSVIGSTPEGGSLTAALANLEGTRANSLVQGTGALAGDEVNRAVQLATFGAAQGNSGLASAAATQAARANAEAQQNAAKSTGVGQAAGAALGAK